MPDRLLLNLENIDVRFGGKPLFEDLTLHITEQDKICLVGRNGAGKTTLMRLIMGKLEPDAGKRFLLPGTRIGYLAQNVAYEPEQTVREFVLSGLVEADRNQDRQHLADMIIAPLSLGAEARMGTLSGGQVRRAALAQALVSEPDLLLLDEPTNHLDLAAIEWLEQYLAAYRGALMCVSHDRAFLAAISRKVFWIDRGQVRVCPHGYAGFEDWAEQVMAQEARELHNMEKKLAAELDWTQGGVSGRRKRNIRRMNELHRLRAKLLAEKAAQKQRKLQIGMEMEDDIPASKIMIEFKKVSKSFPLPGGGELPILKDFNLRIVRGDRIGVLGKNGSGKSTFIKLLTGELEPDAGRVARAKTAEITCFDQQRVELNPEITLWATLAGESDYVFLGSGEKQKPRHVCGYLKDFLFDPRMARDRVSTLSGGQQNRLLLAKVLAKPGNLLILDEPTNDLDMDTLDMLQEILADYAGTLIIVSHDRDFLDRTVTEVLAFEGEGEVGEYIGGYSDYKQARARLAAGFSGASGAGGNKSAFAKAAPGKRSGGKKGISFTQQHELKQLPARMEALEKELAGLKTLLADADFYTADPNAFDAASKRYGELEMELRAAETRWLELEELRVLD